MNDLKLSIHLLFVDSVISLALTFPNILRPKACTLNRIGPCNCVSHLDSVILAGECGGMLTSLVSHLAVSGSSTGNFCIERSLKADTGFPTVCQPDSCLAMNEEDLSKKIRDFLNKSYLNYRFKFIDSFCDIADEKNKIYIEVKPDHFAPAQILHALARENISDAKYLGVADSRTLKLYTPPPFEKILDFARSFDPKFNFTASQVDKPKLNLEAGRILGDPAKIVKLEFETSQYIYITKDNMKSVREKTDKYRIHLDLLIDWLDGVGETDSIKVNKDGWLVNTDKPDIFTNETIQQRKDKELTEFGGFRRPKYIPIKKPDDISYFESLRIRHENLAEVLHNVDRLLTRKKRREGGVFWTEAEIADKLADEISALTKPDYVVEPCVGGGSLIKKMVPHVKGTMNDLSVGHVEHCKRIYDGYDWK